MIWSSSVPEDVRDGLRALVETTAAEVSGNLGVLRERVAALEKTAGLGPAIEELRREVERARTEGRDDRLAVAQLMAQVREISETIQPHYTFLVVDAMTGQDAVTVAERLDPDLVVLVADAGLGTVNAVLTSLAPFAGRPAVVFLNRFDPATDLHRRNLDWLRTRERLEVVVDLEALSTVVRG